MAETSTLRRIIGIFTGMVVGAFTTGVLQSIGHHVAPLPDSVDPSDTETMRTALAEAPPEALLLVLGSYLFGTFGGAAVAGWASHGDRIVVAGSTALLLAAGILNLVMVPHPAWFNALSPLTFIVGGLLAHRLTRNAQENSL